VIHAAGRRIRDRLRLGLLRLRGWLQHTDQDFAVSKDLTGS